MNALRTAVAGCAVALLLLTSAAPAMARPDQADFTQVDARDVFVIVGSTLRHPEESTAPDARLFNVAGVPLELTWGQFGAATATAAAKQVGGKKDPQTTVRLTLAGLVPGGVYSLFYLTIGPDSENPLCPGVERSLPLTAAHPRATQPDAASFYADAEGRATFRGLVPGALLDAQQLFYTVIYHFNGQSYGNLPNAGEFLTQGANCHSSFGDDAMRQLLVAQKFS
jgi:hypothetical protein